MAFAESGSEQSGQRNEREAFDGLYSMYKSSVYRFAFHLTRNMEEADDLFQEAWLRVARHFSKIQDIRDFRTWVFAIVANLHRDDLRKKRIRRIHLFLRPDHDHSDSPRHQDTAHGTFEPEDADVRLAVAKALTRLPGKQSRVFVLKEMEGFKCSEISRILNIPEGTVKSLMHRAVKRLQQEMSDYRPE